MNDSTQSAELIQELHDPRLRRAARQKLVAARAVEPLLECLKATNESVVWAAVESLQELRAREAVEPLVELLERGVLAVDVCEALTAITGNSFGADARKWRDWLRQSGPAAAAEFNAAECLRRTGELLGVEPAVSGNSYLFRLSLAGGRWQKVAVICGRQDSEGESLVIIYSECGPADPKHYESVLRKNMTIPAGAFALRDIDGRPNLVIVDTMLAASVTPSVLAKKVENIAARADGVEKLLTKEDKR
jgi:hypothetical protein